VKNHRTRIECSVLISFLFGVCLLAACRPLTVIPLPMPTALPIMSPMPAMVCATAGTHAEQLTSGGQTRQYWLHVPPAYQPGQLIPLVLGFHGNGGRADQFESYSGFSALADRAGFIAAYPQGLGNPASWNTGPGAANEDVQFVRDLLDHLETRCSIDPARIYAIGHSRGGGLANRLACNLSERIAAIGPVSGAYQDGDVCSPLRPVPVVAIHGFDDPVVPYNGFPSGGVPGAYFIIGTPIPQWASAWAQRNGCSTKPSVVMQTDKLSEQQWGTCQNGADVVLYTLKGWGHNWPVEEFGAAQVIWDFLAQHPYK
jgi:polyhydroxybutyrate depolymerase